MDTLQSKEELYAKWLQEKAITLATANSNFLQIRSVEEACEDIGMATTAYYRKLEGFTCAVVIPILEDVKQAVFLPKQEDYNNKYQTKGKGGIFTPNMMVHTDQSQDTLLFMESAPKAIAVRQRGHYAIGGNGVDGIVGKLGEFRGIEGSLEELENYKNLVVLFDKDFECNEKIRQSAARLVNALKQKFPEANVGIKRIPIDACPDDPKAGIDDCIVAEGEEWFTEFMAAPLDKEDDRLTKHKKELNEAYRYIHHPPCVMDRRISQPMKVRAVRDSEMPRCYGDFDVSGKNPKPIEVEPVVEWMKWEERGFCDTIVLKPGEGELVDVAGGVGYNIWEAGDVEQGTGDVQCFLNVYENAIPDKRELEILLDSVAWMLQNRGTRLPKVFFLAGTRQGTGKSFFVETIGKMMGRKNYASVTAEQFSSPFNSPWATKEFVVIDDADKLNKEQVALLKTVVTRATNIVNTKNMVQYEVDNHCVIFVTANSYGSISMEMEARRVVPIVFAPRTYYPGGSGHWNEVVKWRDERGGLGDLYGWLMRRDVGEFDPNAHPEMTSGRGEVQQANLNEYESWGSELVGDFAGMTGGCGRAVFTIKEVWELYKMTSGNEVYIDPGDGRALKSAHTRLAKALTECGFRHSNYDSAGRPQRLRIAGGQGSYWVLDGLEEEWHDSRVMANVVEHPLGMGPTYFKKI